MDTKAVNLTQAIIDNDSDATMSLLSDPSVKTWVSNEVPTKSLTNHRLNDHVTTTSALDRACFFSSLSTVRAVVNAGAELYIISSSSYNALHSVLESNNERMQKTKFFIQCDCNIINGKTKGNKNAAHVAATLGFTDALQYLLQCNEALMDQMDICGMLPIHIAARNGHSECIEVFHNINQNMNIRGGKFNTTCLHYAAQNGHPRCIKTLVKLGADTQLDDSIGSSALHYAAANGHTQCIDILVNECGIDINMVDNRNQTALFFAACNGYINVVRKLIMHGDCDCFMPNSDGKTARMIAVEKKHNHIADILVDCEQDQEHKKIGKRLEKKRLLSSLKREFDTGSSDTFDTNEDQVARTFENVAPRQKDTVTASKKPRTNRDSAVKMFQVTLQAGSLDGSTRSNQNENTIQTNVKASATSDIEESRIINEITCARNPWAYSMEPASDTHGYPRDAQGFVLMIVNFTGELRGYLKDRVDLRSFFEDIGYEVHEAMNCTRQQIFDAIESFKAHILSSALGIKCVVVAILSHGSEDGIFSCADPRGIGYEWNNSVKVKFPVEDIIIRFKHDGDANQNLKGVPKFFIVQACQGSRIVRAAADLYSEQEENNVEMNEQPEIDQIHRAPVPVDADILIMSASTKYNKSFVCEDGGSWLVQKILEVFRQHHEHTGVEGMLRKVTLAVSNMRGTDNRTAEDAIQIPVRSSTLRFEFFL